MSELVLRQVSGQVAVLTLNRSERHNSLVPALLTDLLNQLTAVASADNIGALVLQANGRSFSTGGDARGFVEHAAGIAAYSARIVGLLNECLLALIDLPMPVITAVHGQTTGGSMGLVLASDLVLVAPEASFTPFYSVVGPSPDGGWTALLPRIIGRRRAAAVLYGNETISAETAVALGLANELVPQAQIRGRALALAQDIAAKKTGSIRRSKQLLWPDRTEIAAALENERGHFIQEMSEGAGLAGFQTFLEQLRG